MLNGTAVESHLFTSEMIGLLSGFNSVTIGVTVISLLPN